MLPLPTRLTNAFACVVGPMSRKLRSHGFKWFDLEELAVLLRVIGVF